MEFDAATWEKVGRVLGAGIAVGFGGMGTALGMGMATARASEALMRQPETRGMMIRTMLIGQAVGEAPAVLALVVGLVVIFGPLSMVGPYLTMTAIGAGIAVGFGSMGSGWGCGFPAGEACAGLARNPRHQGRITSTMILSQAVAQSPCVFALVISLILLFTDRPVSLWEGWGKCLGAGIAMGLGAIGPGIGCGITAGGGVRAVAQYPNTHSRVMRAMLLGQAIVQTPAIFGLMIALFILVALTSIDPGIVGFAMCVGAGISVGFGGIGSGVGCGFASEAACMVVAAKPRLEASVMRTMLVGQAVAQSPVICALVVSLLLLFAMN